MLGKTLACNPKRNGIGTLIILAGLALHVPIHADGTTSEQVVGKIVIDTAGLVTVSPADSGNEWQAAGCSGEEISLNIPSNHSQRNLWLSALYIAKASGRKVKAVFHCTTKATKELTVL